MTKCYLRPGLYIEIDREAQRLVNAEMNEAGYAESG